MVVGAGPAGVHAAYRLAQAGYHVLVVEEHQAVGRPVHCSGLVGREAFERYDLPRDTVLRGFDRARFVSPGGVEALVIAEDVVAYAVDRGAFDLRLAERAQESGAELRLGTRCVGVVGEGERGVRVKLAPPDGNQEVRARAVVLATGARYGLGELCGAGRPPRFVRTAQVETVVAGVGDEIEVYLAGSLGRGAFGWVIPTSGGRAKVGVCTPGKALPAFEALLAHPPLEGRFSNGMLRPRSRPIPVRPARRTYGDRVLLVGDAAGQVKPTTAGGIHYGIACAEVAARVLDGALRAGDLGARRLARYEREWRREIGRELLVGWLFRWLGERLSDGRVDRLVRAYREPAVRELVRRYASFEWHSGFIVALLRSPVVWRVLLGPGGMNGNGTRRLGERAF